MKTLIVEDDFTSRLMLQEILKHFGDVHMAVNGKEAVTAACAAIDAGEPYDLICLDIMMPEMDGYAALEAIRAREEAVGIRSSLGTKVIVVSALDQMKSVMKAFRGLCDAYLFKPLDRQKLIGHLHSFGLIGQAATAPVSIEP